MTSSMTHIIQEHAWFNEIDWVKMYNKELQPPFVPQLKSGEDTHLFDDIFTKEPAFDSPIATPLSHTHHGAFEGFTYTGNTYICNYICIYM